MISTKGTLSQSRNWPRWIGAASLPLDLAHQQTPEQPQCKRFNLVPAADERLGNVAQLVATHVSNHSLL